MNPDINITAPVGVFGLGNVLMGDDALGRVVRDIVSRRDPRLADGMVMDTISGTSYTVIISPPGVDRIFFHSPGANNTSPPADSPRATAGIEGRKHGDRSSFQAHPGDPAEPLQGRREVPLRGSPDEAERRLLGLL